MTLRYNYFGVNAGIALSPFKITGTLLVGQVLSVVANTTPAWLVPTGQWYADGAAISGETANTFTVKSAQLGKLVTFVPLNMPTIKVTAGTITVPVVIPSISVAPVLSALVAGAGLSFTAGTFVGTPTYNLMRGTTVVKAGASVGDIVAGVVADDQVFIRLVVTSPGQSTVQADSNTVTVTSAGAGLVTFPNVAYATKAMINNSGGGTIPAISSTGSTGLTYQVQTVVESPYNKVQIGLLNYDTVAVTARVMATGWAALQADNSAAANYNDATWTELSKGGSGDVVLAPRVAGNNDLGTITWTDATDLVSVARTDAGKTLTGLSVRIGIGPNQNVSSLPAPPTSTPSWESDTSTNPRPYRVRSEGVMAATIATKTALTRTTVSTTWPLVFIRYWPSNGSVPKTLILCGDSITAAGGGSVSGVTLPRFGWAEQFRAQYSTPQAPVEISNCGLAGAVLAQIVSMLASVGPGLAGSGVVVMPNGTPNGTGTTLYGANATAWQTYETNARATCTANGLPSLFWTMLPVGEAVKAWGASDSVRTGMNTQAMASGRPFMNFAAQVSGTPLSSGQIPLTDSGDNLHPSDAGNAKFVPLLSAATGIQAPVNYNVYMVDGYPYMVDGYPYIINS